MKTRAVNRQWRINLVTQNARALACQNPTRVRYAIRTKRKTATVSWDLEDICIYDSHSSYNTDLKTSDGEPFKGVILYWDKFLNWCGVKRYKSQVLEKAEEVSAWQHWRALGLWTTYVDRAQVQGEVGH